MKIFSSKLQEPYYTYIKDGIKIYELRVNDEKRKKMKIGNIWKFKNANNENLPEYNTIIIDKKIYKSFEEAIEKTSYKKLLPNSKSIKEAIKTYNSFDNGMYELDAKKYGVVCFKLKVIKHNMIIKKSFPKNIEARLYNSKCLSYQIGDILVFVNSETNEKCSKIIINVRKYKNLEDYLSNEKHKKQLPLSRFGSEKQRNKLEEKYGFCIIVFEVE
jgi:ASC-1-like (ASCH) protein